MALKINGIRVAGIGSDGKNGAGVVTGGTVGQVLSKKTELDYDTEWISLPSIDSTLSTEGAAADAKAVGDQISNLSNLVGDTPVAEQIAASAVDLSTFRVYAGQLDIESLGEGATAEGQDASAEGKYSHVEGRYSTAYGDYSHVEGGYSTAFGNYSHAEGGYTASNGEYSHAEGENTTTFSEASHAEGINVISFGIGSHAEGYGESTPPDTITEETTKDEAYDIWYETEDFSIAIGDGSHVEGRNNVAYGEAAHAEGYNVEAYGDYSHAEGYDTQATGKISHAEGERTSANGDYSHAEGYGAHAYNNYSHAEGYTTRAHGDYSHAEGYKTTTYGQYSHAEGYSISGAFSEHGLLESSTNDEIIATWENLGIENAFSLARGNGSHVEGLNCLALGTRAHSEGYGAIALGNNSHSEGSITKASGQYSHAEGYGAKALGSASHAEGWGTKADKYASHAEGQGAQATNNNTHAEGYYTVASGDCSHAEGLYTIAASHAQHAQGKYNIKDSAQTYLHIVGNGTADDARSNAHTLDWDGNAWFAGAIKVGGTGQNDTAAKDVILSPRTALVGQVLTVKAVDENNKPTNWGTYDISKANWSVNNPEADSYILNRTHWAEEEIQNVIPLTTDTETVIVRGQIEIEGINPYNPSYEIDIDYYVNFDGTTFLCRSYRTPAVSFAIGNSKLGNIVDENGNGINIEGPLPFFITAESDDGGLVYNATVYDNWYFTYSDSETHTIKIDKLTGHLIYHTLDEQYIPDTIARVSDIDNTTVSATQTKASTEYTEEDAEIWIFNCGTSTVLV